MPDFNTILSRAPSVEPDLARVRQIEGWLADEAADLTCRLARLQLAMGQATGVLELGVFKGRYLALLSSLYPADVPVVGVDGLLARIGEPLDEQSRAGAEKAVRDNVASVAGPDRPITIVGCLTQDVDLHELARLCPEGYSFISVDAGHEAENLVVDLHIATSVAVSAGIIALDDVFNPTVPGVSEGVYRYFQQNPDCPFRPFAIGGNKVFLAGSTVHPTYLAYAKWLMSSGGDTSYLRKSGALETHHKNANFVPRFLGSETAIFTWG